MVKKAFKSFINPFTLILIFLAIISFITNFLIVNPADRDLTTVIILLAMVTISGLLRFLQEIRSNNSTKEFISMVKTTTTIERKIRGKIELFLKEFVVGDIIHLAADDMIPVYVRIISSKDLFIS